MAERRVGSTCSSVYSWLWDHPIDPRGVQERLSAYLEHGGSLFITGQHIAEHFGQGGDNERRWLGRNLRAGFGGQDGFQNFVGEGGDPIGDGIVAGLQGGDGANNAHGGPDILRPAQGAQPVFRYGTASAETYGVAAVRARQGQSRVVFFGFPFESINVSSTRNEVMSRVMGWINPTCNGRASTIDGTGGSDTIRGTAHDDVIVTFAGMDFVWGGEGNDVICGGKDVDVLDGGPGNDWIDGMHGSDVLKGGWGNDKIYGGWGRDIVLGGGGHDFIDAGIGHDQVSGGMGADVILGSWGNDYLAGDEGDDVIFGGPGVDAFACGGGLDVAVGGAGADTSPAPGCEWTSSIP